MNAFLLGVDWEDIRARLPDGWTREARVQENTRRILRFLKKHKARCTFFVVGELVEQEPQAFEEILEAGHEIACHTQHHTPLEQLGPDGLRRDLEATLKTLNSRGVTSVAGFRAPCFSLTHKSAWAYQVLKEYDFLYSSSVVPAANPIYGWPGFGQLSRTIDGILELPISLSPLPFLRVPHSGGVYLRAIPAFFTHLCHRWSLRRYGFVTGYIHPYDVDNLESRVHVPELGENPLHQFLFYYNRGRMLDRLAGLLQGGHTMTYFDYVTTT